MKRNTILKNLWFSLILGCWFLVMASVAMAQDAIKFNCSNQVYSAFSKEHIDAFTKVTGIKVNVKTASSNACIVSLGRGFCDIAGTARKLHNHHDDYGYKEFPFCIDPIAVIAKKGCGVDGLTEAQLQDIFAGDIKNWKEVGGANLPVMIIVPGKETAVHKNFRRHVMKTKDIQQDFMAYNSTMVIEAVTYFPCGSISFISQGAAVQNESLKTIKINGLLPGDKNYPYHQIFYYVTKKEPTGGLMKFIDFTYSEAGSEIIRKYGMLPLLR
jgi:phosphate transport system substrate-binding protein